MKRILKNGILRYWQDGMQSQWCFYIWTLYLKEDSIFRINLVSTLHLIFFFKEDDLYTEIPQDVSVGQIHIIQANSISFFRIHFKAWHGKYLVTQQELQDHTCLLSKKLSVITAFTHIHFHSHIILQSKWAVMSLRGLPMCSKVIYALEHFIKGVRKAKLTYFFHFKFFIYQFIASIWKEYFFFTEQSYIFSYKAGEGLGETILVVFPFWNHLETLRYDAERS